MLRLPLSYYLGYEGAKAAGQDIANDNYAGAALSFTGSVLAFYGAGNDTRSVLNKFGVDLKFNSGTQLAPATGLPDISFELNYVNRREALAGILEADYLTSIITPKSNKTWYLYQKVGPNEEHLKFGITTDLKNRYSNKELGGGRLRVLAQGTESKISQLEDELHEMLPLGPQEREPYWRKVQEERGYHNP